MSEPKNDWNPEDGPPPTAEELAEARALADALAGTGATRQRGADPEFDALWDVALRVRATAHPDTVHTRAAAAEAISHALESAAPRWYRSRWTWLGAVAAALVLGVAGIGLATRVTSVTDAGEAISRPADDAFSNPIPRDARSEPIGRIYDSRMLSYREVILHGRARRLP